MLKTKYTVAICTIISLMTLGITVLFTAGNSLGIITRYAEMPYTKKLFDINRVHSLDVMVKESDWEQMLANAVAEEYIPCTVVIDGEAVKNVGIRPKGNSSLIKAFEADTDRYSFKIEFDHYVKGKTYYGLDKLALNNMSQDYTYLKDFLSFDMMNEFGAEAPLYSFINIKVNGKAQGLYLAVEGIGKAFAKRTYGSDFGKIYKPDTPGMQANQQRGEGGGPGAPPPGGGAPAGEGKPNPVTLVYTDDNPDNYREIFDHAVFKTSDSDKARLLASLKTLNEGTGIETILNTEEILRYFVVHNFVLNWDSYTGMLMHNYYLHEGKGVLSMIAWDYNLAFGGFDRGGGGRPAFRPEGAGAPAGPPAQTGGRPPEGGWGGTRTSAAGWVNFPIDTPVFGASFETRPMLSWIFKDERYTEQYHYLLGEFIHTYFDSGDFEKKYDHIVSLISPYIEKDPTAFCTYSDFIAAQQVLKQFCLLRAKSIALQLAGSIGKTSSEQSASRNAGFVDASGLDLDLMGNSFAGFETGRKITD